MTPFPAWPGAFDARGNAVASLVQAFGAQGYAVSSLRPEQSEAASVNARKRFAFSPRHSFLSCPIVRSVDDFLSCRFSLATSATFACPVQCCVRFAHPAFRNRTSAGDVWHTKRDVPVLLLSSGKLIKGRYFFVGRRSSAAGTRLTQRRTAINAERATSTRPVLSKKDRTAPAFFGFTLLLPPRRGLRGFQCPTREVVRRPLFPPLRGSFPVGGI